MGGCEVGLSGSAEPPLKYHSGGVLVLTPHRDPGGGQRLVGSLTGAVASQKVTEASKGPLRLDGNQPLECIGIRGLDCKTHKSSRDESRAK